MVLGHLFLTMSSAFAINLHSTYKFTWSLSGFVLCCGHGILGLFFPCNKTCVCSIFDVSLNIVEILAVSFMCADISEIEGYQDLGYMQGISGLFVLLASLVLDSCTHDNLIDSILICNLIILAGLGMKLKKILYFILAGIAAFNHFHICQFDDTTEGLSYGLTAFVLVAAYIIKKPEFTKYL